MGVEVVDDLGENAGPVDRINSSKPVGGIELGVGEERLDGVLKGQGYWGQCQVEQPESASRSAATAFANQDHVGRDNETHLAVVERAIDGETVNIGIEDGRHLSLLDSRDTAFGEEHKDGDVGLAADAVDGSTGEACVRQVRRQRDRDHRSQTRDRQGAVGEVGNAHLPVSPLVAPTIVSLSRGSPSFLAAFLRLRKYSKRLPRNWSATSLNANVGPWKSSRMYSWAESLTSGVWFGWRNVEYEASISDLRSAEGISSSGMKRERILCDNSGNESPRQAFSQSTGSSGIVSGM